MFNDGKVSNQKETLCWYCKNAMLVCPWSLHFKPVKGWSAHKTKLQINNGNGRQYIDSFLVKKCPKFEEG